MKKALWTVGIIIVAGLAFLFYKENQSLPPLDPSNNTASSTSATSGDGSGTTFRSADNRIVFTYPNTLNVSEQNNIITLEHHIVYSNNDACDFKGTPSGTTQTDPNFTDFDVTMQAYNMTIASTAAAVDPSLPPTDFDNGTLVLTPGFIQSYNNGVWNGYTITEGVEGCGQTTYYLPISSSRTLVIQKMLIGAFSDVADQTKKQQILNRQGIISPDQSDQIFSNIIGSLQVH